MLAQRLFWVVWPAFLVAGVLEMVVFALVDPHELHWLGWHSELSRSAFYSLSFFFFWIVTLASSTLTALLAQPAPQGRHGQQAGGH